MLELGHTAGIAERFRLLVARQDARTAKINFRRLALRNRFCRRPVVEANGGPVVSLTTYGERLHTVYLTLESIAEGFQLPSRLILWLDEDAALRNLPHSLRRLQARGLEIRKTNNFGPHKKYYPYVAATARPTLPLVTADDDFIYPRNWLQRLVAGYLAEPGLLSCFRAHRLRIIDNQLAPYDNWNACQTVNPSFLHFATNGAGSIFPPALQHALRIAGRQFETTCPFADDIWIHVTALRAAILTRQLHARSVLFTAIPITQRASLYQLNVLRKQNDIQILRTYTSSDLRALISCERDADPRTRVFQTGERMPDASHARHAYAAEDP